MVQQMRLSCFAPLSAFYLKHLQNIFAKLQNYHSFQNGWRLCSLTLNSILADFDIWRWIVHRCYCTHKQVYRGSNTDGPIDVNAEIGPEEVDGPNFIRNKLGEDRRSILWRLDLDDVIDENSTFLCKNSAGFLSEGRWQAACLTGSSAGFFAANFTTYL